MRNNEIKEELLNIKLKFDRGDYNKYMNMPFLSKEKVYTFIKNKMIFKVSKGQNPLLTEYEIKDCITSAIENIGVSFNIFLKSGILRKNEDNTYELTKAGEKILSQSYTF